MAKNSARARQTASVGPGGSGRGLRLARRVDRRPAMEEPHAPVSSRSLPCAQHRHGRPGAHRANERARRRSVRSRRHLPAPRRRGGFAGALPAAARARDRSGRQLGRMRGVVFLGSLGPSPSEPARHAGQPLASADGGSRVRARFRSGVGNHAKSKRLQPKLDFAAGPGSAATHRDGLTRSVPRLQRLSLVASTLGMTGGRRPGPNRSKRLAGSLGLALREAG